MHLFFIVISHFGIVATMYIVIGKVETVSPITFYRYSSLWPNIFCKITYFSTFQTFIHYFHQKLMWYA